MHFYRAECEQKLARTPDETQKKTFNLFTIRESAAVFDAMRARKRKGGVKKKQAPTVFNDRKKCDIHLIAFAFRNDLSRRINTNEKSGKNHV